MKSTSDRPRLLCLHSTCLNSKITKMQIIGLNLRYMFDITYLNVPHVVAQPLSGLKNFANGPYYAWSNPSRSLEARKDQWTESMICVIRGMQEDACMVQ